ncbi:oligomeric Golgi complex subunit 6 [Catenaria anguillulae PL171]|uniref:Conserved oligomeric Golgi complex subunit 6 n=1 Tax=Catenaria anguillulae PL171 TaxID=765915 RepID=A0A1Y2HSL8_9FUNG|nr:oligomeric Golgi complex subunit 6 [Catenaria anguillulae PL171]
MDPPSSSSPSPSSLAVVQQQLAAALDTPFLRAASAADRDAQRRLAASLLALDQWLGPNGTADSLVKHIDTVADNVQSIRSTVDTMAADLEAARGPTAQFVRVAAEQQAVIDSVSAEQAQVTAFLAEYTLTPSETALLSSPSSDLNPEFFAAFDRAAKIEQMTKSSLDYPNSPLSRDIVSTMSSLLETAHDRLYAWLQSRLSLFMTLSPDIPISMSMAVTRLARGRPVLLDSILDDAATHRRTAISRWFADSMVSLSSSNMAIGAPSSSSSTGSGGLGSTSPRNAGSRRGSLAGGSTSLAADDAERQVADVYAWVHQVIAAEFALWLMEVGPDGAIPRSKAVGLVDVAIESVCRSVFGRVETIVAKASIAGTTAMAGGVGGVSGMLGADVVAPYRVYHVLGVNRQVLLKSLPATSSIVNTTQELQAFALRQFRDALDNQGQLLRTSYDPIDTSTLVPTSNVSRTAAALQAVASTRARYIRRTSTAPTSPKLDPATEDYEDDTDVSDGRIRSNTRPTASTERMELRAILDMLIDPCVQSCVVAASSSTISRAAGAVFAINCLRVLKEAVKDLSADKAAALESQIEIYLDSLVTEYYSAFISHTGLRTIFDALDHDANKALNIDPSELQSALLRLDAVLMTGAPHLDLSHDLARLSTSALAKRVVTLGTALFTQSYAKLHAEVAKDERGVFAGVVMRSVTEVESLLRV